VSPAGPALAGWAERLARDAIGTGTGLKPFADKLTTDLILVGADIAPTLLRECTQQSVRVRLGEDKTVENGPFYCEYLPAETIMAASLTLRGAADTIQIRQALTELLDDRLVQVGGDETIGKGLVWTRLASGSPV
jgi:CRISPR-associated protein Cmr4